MFQHCFLLPSFSFLKEKRKKVSWKEDWAAAALKPLFRKEKLYSIERIANCKKVSLERILLNSGVGTATQESFGLLFRRNPERLLPT